MFDSKESYKLDLEFNLKGLPFLVLTRGIQELLKLVIISVILMTFDRRVVL